MARNKLLLLLILFSPAARAEDADGFPEFFCLPVASAKPPSGYCEDNDAFIKAAELCLKRLRAEMAREQELIKGYFSKKEQDHQNVNFQESRFNHRQASQRLARLLRLTKKTAMEIDSYFDGVYFPTDSEMPSVNGGSFENFVMEEPCYGQTVRTLEAVVQDVVQIGRELNATKQSSDQIAGVLDQSDEKITNLAGQKLTKGRAPASGPVPKKVVRGKHKGSDSTITGEVHKQVDTESLNKK